MAGNLSFIMLLVAAMAVSDLYPPGGCALRKRSLNVFTSSGDRVPPRLLVRVGPELGGTGGWAGDGMSTGLGTFVP